MHDDLSVMGKMLALGGGAHDSSMPFFSAGAAGVGRARCFGGIEELRRHYKSKSFHVDILCPIPHLP
jgi:hypothetical protein